MAKIRPKPSNNKIDGKPDSTRSCCSSQHPWVSFKDLTKNSKYNLTRLPAGNERDKVLRNLHCRLNELSSQPWLYWTQQPKHTGLETLNYHELNFTAGADAQLTKESTIYVFRFDTHQGPEKGRIIVYKNSPCSVLHIIGYDLDFSAYNHGK